MCNKKEINEDVIFPPKKPQPKPSTPAPKPKPVPTPKPKQKGLLLD